MPRLFQYVSHSTFIPFHKKLKLILFFEFGVYYVYVHHRTTVFSHSQTVVVCGNCQTILCQPTGGKARLTEGCSFRKKGV